MTRKFCGLVLAIGWISSFAQLVAADIPPPPKEAEVKGNTVTVSLRVRNSVDGATRLIIPRQFIVAEAAEAVRDSQGNNDSPSRTRTLLAGVAISLAAVSFVLVRLKRSNPRMVATGVLLAAACFAIGIATADIAIPGRERRPRPVRQPLPTVVIEYTDGGDIVELQRGKDFPKQ